MSIPRLENAFFSLPTCDEPGGSRHSYRSNSIAAIMRSSYCEKLCAGHTRGTDENGSHGSLPDDPTPFALPNVTPVGEAEDGDSVNRSGRNTSGSRQIALEWWIA